MKSTVPKRRVNPLMAARLAVVLAFLWSLMLPFAGRSSPMFPMVLSGLGLLTGLVVWLLADIRDDLRRQNRLLETLVQHLSERAERSEKVES